MLGRVCLKSMPILLLLRTSRGHVNGEQLPVTQPLFSRLSFAITHLNPVAACCLHGHKCLLIRHTCGYTLVSALLFVSNDGKEKDNMWHSWCYAEHVSFSFLPWRLGQLLLGPVKLKQLLM